MRLPVLAFLLLAAAAAAAAPPGSVEATTCWACHAPGRWVPALEPPGVVDHRFEPGHLVATVENPWIHDLVDIYGVVSGPLQPVAGDTVILREAGASLPRAIDDAPVVFHLDLPNGTQAVRATLETEGLHTLDLVVRPGGRDSAAMSFGVRDVAAAGWHGWVFEVHRRDLLPTTADFVLVVEADAVPQPDGWLAAAPPAGPLQQTEVRWPVAANAAGLSFELFFVMQYAHADPANPDRDAARVEDSPQPLDAAPLDEEVPAPAWIAALALALAWLRRPVP